MVSPFKSNTVRKLGICLNGWILGRYRFIDGVEELPILWERLAEKVKMIFPYDTDALGVVRSHFISFPP